VPSELNNVALVLIVFLLGIFAAAAVALLIRCVILPTPLSVFPLHLFRKRLEMVALERDREQDQRESSKKESDGAEEKRESEEFAEGGDREERKLVGTFLLLPSFCQLSSHPRREA
jgi:uncharacterized membrane protein YgcG